MSESGLSVLRELLVLKYEDLKRHLTWKFGSSELASDALHDAWMRLDARAADVGPLDNPSAYLTRMATNLALDRLERDRRYLSAEEMDQLMAEVADPAPGPERAATGRDELRLLQRLIERMPPRRRAIFLAVRVEGLSNQEASARFRVSPRLIGLELKRAHEYCIAHLPEDR